MYLGNRPFTSLFENRLEFMNDFLASCTLYVMLAFTDYSNERMKEKSGLFFIGFLAFNLLVNIIIVLFFIV